MTDNWLRVPKLNKILDKIPPIECFQSLGQHLFKFIGTKEKVFAQEKSSNPTGPVWDINMAAVLLFWNTNMAAMTSCENTL